jgi:integrase
MPRKRGVSAQRKRELALAKKRARVLTMMKPDEVKVELWLSSYLALFPSERSAKSERDTLSILNGFRREHGHRMVCEVTPLLAQAWAMEHPGQVRYLRQAWHKAVVMGVAQVNVWRLVTMPKRQKEHVRPPNLGELMLILGRCRGEEKDAPVGQRWWWEEFALMIEVAAYSGAREGGLIELRRRDVKLTLGRMTLTEKGGKTRTAALIGPAHAAMALQLRRSRHIDGRVFHSPRGLPLAGQGVRVAWRRVRGEFPHGFHSLRHFAATWLRAQGVEDRDVAIQLGHTDSEGRPQVRLQDRVYVHPDPEEALKRITAITTKGGNNDGTRSPASAVL